MESFEQYQIIEEEKMSELKEISIPGEPPLILTLLEIYFSETPLLYKNLLAALELGNFGDIQRYSHKLSGSCGNFGGIRMTEVCRQMERLSVSENLSEAQALRPHLENAYSEFSEILKKELDSLT